MIEPNLSKETLNTWIESQDPWTLEVAIWLLLRVDPASRPKHTIRDDNPKLPLAVKRAYSKARDAISDGRLKQIPGGKAMKNRAADFRVHKRKFIAWAAKEWSAASHLTEALSAYDSLELKPWQIEPETKAEASYRVFVEVMDKLLPLERTSISNRRLHKKMKDHSDSDSGIYGLTKTNAKLPKWKESYAKA